MGISKIFKKVIFWEAVRDTLFYLGAPSTLGLFAAEEKGIVDGFWVYFAGSLTFLGGLIAKWLVDKNANGIIDWFE